MDKLELLSKVKDNKYTHDKLVGWIGALPGSSNFKSPSFYKAGDVFMHPVFKHPYVLLKKKRNGSWISTLLTSEKECTEALEPCKSRFFKNELLTKVLFTSSIIVGSYLGVYDNSKHLREVLIKLKQELL